MSIFGKRDRPRLLAEFVSPEEMVRALETLSEAGYRKLETYTPFDMPRTTPALGLRRPLLPWIVALAGLSGGIVAYWIQWFANSWSYPLNVGGRPIHPVPAFIPATFEGTVLAAALVAFFGLFISLRLPALWHPVFEIDGFDRSTVDRFWIEVGGVQSDLDAHEMRRIVTEAGALRVVPLDMEGA
ncbi:MAG TPA: DUF3341 domain-containing protein [Gemmatimonadaceae bacterium]|nr:DUF3341 domain-containing protein [Gemmatimonadaceae bacterium]